MKFNVHQEAPEIQFIIRRDNLREKTTYTNTLRNSTFSMKTTYIQLKKPIQNSSLHFYVARQRHRLNTVTHCPPPPYFAIKNIPPSFTKCTLHSPRLQKVSIPEHQFMMVLATLLNSTCQVSFLPT